MGPVKILGWHTKMVLLVATQIQLQSVAVYCIPLDSFSLKRQYASNTFTSSLRNPQTFQKNTFVSCQTARLQQISTSTGEDLNYSSPLSQQLSQSVKLVGVLGGPVGWPAIFQGVAMAPLAPPLGHHCLHPAFLFSHPGWMLCISPLDIVV